MSSVQRKVPQNRPTASPRPMVKMTVCCWVQQMGQSSANQRETDSALYFGLGLWSRLDLRTVCCLVRHSTSVLTMAACWEYPSAGWRGADSVLSIETAENLARSMGLSWDCSTDCYWEPNFCSACWTVRHSASLMEVPMDQRLVRYFRSANWMAKNSASWMGCPMASTKVENSVPTREFAMEWSWDLY